MQFYAVHYNEEGTHEVGVYEAGTDEVLTTITNENIGLDSEDEIDLTLEDIKEYLVDNNFINYNDEVL